MLGVACAGCLGKISEEGPKPATILIRHDFTRIARSCLCGGADEPTPAKLGPCQQPFNLAEYAQEALFRRVVCGQNLGDAALPSAEVLLKVGADELVLAAKGVVEGGLCDACPFNNPVNPDDMHAFGIEKLVGGGKQTISCGQATRSLRLQRGGALGGLHCNRFIVPTGLFTSERVSYRPFCLAIPNKGAYPNADDRCARSGGNVQLGVVREVTDIVAAARRELGAK
jgi:hypothetical protein